ncbi:MAG: DUF935 family protein [Chitinophagaceae bacterium]
MNEISNKSSIEILKSESNSIDIINYITTRPTLRKHFDLGDWRNALIYAESFNGTRTLLYDLYEDVLLDTYLSGQWSKRIMGITNDDVMFFTKEGKRIPEVDILMDSPEFEELLIEIMQSKAWGISLIELANDNCIEIGKAIKRLNLYSVPRKHIRPKQGLIVKDQYESSSAGIKYREGAYSNFVAEIGKCDELGLLLKAVPYVLLKRGNVGDWAQFVQLFGIPFREYRYNGYDVATEEIIKKNAEEMGSAPYIILPDGASITLHEIKNSGQGAGDIFQKLADFCDKQISIFILGNTLTTQPGKTGSYALGNIHRDTQNEILKDDKKSVIRILNTIIKPILYNLGWPVKDGSFSFTKRVDTKEQLSEVELLSEMKNLGAVISDEQIYKSAGIAKPKNYEELKGKM